MIWAMEGWGGWYDTCGHYCVHNKQKGNVQYVWWKGEQSPEFMWSLPEIHDETIKIHSVILGDGPRGKGAVFGFDNTK